MVLKKATISLVRLAKPFAIKCRIAKNKDFGEYAYENGLQINMG